jgi:hypothetical protein
MPWRVAGRDEILKAGNCVDRHTRFLRFDPTPRKGQVWVQRGADSGGLQHQLSDPVSPLPQHFETSWMFCLLTYPLVVAPGGSSRPQHTTLSQFIHLPQRTLQDSSKSYYLINLLVSLTVVAKGFATKF